METIKKYVERFFEEKKENENYSLTVNDATAFANEIRSADGNCLFYAIVSLFRYGYAKGYRAAMAETRKRRTAS